MGHEVGSREVKKEVSNEMKRNIFVLTSTFLVFVSLLLVLNADAAQKGMANPAAVYCNGLGYRYEVKNGPQGQYGVCIFPDNSTCEEWSFFRGKC